MRRSSSIRCLPILLGVILTTLPAFAAAPTKDSPLHEKEYRQADLEIRNTYRQGDRITGEGSAWTARLEALGISPEHAYLDVRTDRWGTLMPTTPLLPGSGVGNTLSWADLQVSSPMDTRSYQEVAWQTLRGYLQKHGSHLRLDTGELTSGRFGIYKDLIQVHVGRQIDGIPVRDSHLTAVVSHGNLVLLGMINWGDIEISTTPSTSVEVAWDGLQSHMGTDFPGFERHSQWGKTELILVPTARGDLATIEIGEGLDYQLAWVLRPSIRNEIGHWEALVDAHSGELLSFRDTNSYGTPQPRQIVGGVYPESPDDTEESGWPMPFTFVTAGAETLTTTTGGNLATCIGGSVSTSLEGSFVAVNDDCGPVNESSTGSVLDLGTGSGENCAVPTGAASLGNTHSARTGFYHLNRAAETARGYLPENTWLQSRLTANMNLNSDTCNAWWEQGDGTVNFYRSGGGCANTGEIAGVLAHEWGHGMDDNDVEGTLSQPAEGIADIYASLRLSTSCIGRGFLQSGFCGGDGDPCTECTGMRELDWAKRLSGVPHNIDFIQYACASGSDGSPCGGESECEGQVYAEAIYDLYQRDLQSLYGMDLNTAREVTTRLTFLGAGLVDNWFQCSTPHGGCNADGGYLNFLAADDDNGTLTDGTPHMQAIYNAYNRHQIACNSPIVADSGCAGTPTTAVAVTATNVDSGVQLNWSALAGASSYKVYRGEGLNEGGELIEGRTLIGTVEATGSEFQLSDTGLLNGREYFYNVFAMGPSESCFGPASNTVIGVPATGAQLVIDGLTVDMTINGGDEDDFLDNCEQAVFTFDVSNVGTAAATNVVLSNVRSTTHPEIDGSISFPSAVGTLDSCTSGSSSFKFFAQGLSALEEVEFEVCLSSDELGATELCGTVSTAMTESDFQSTASATWNFDSDLDGWTVEQGTFTHDSGAGSGGGAGFAASSAFLNVQCDQIGSPLMRLSSTSTVQLQTNFEIEEMDGQWWDRANVGIEEFGGARTTLVPTGGRLYNASGPGGSCDLDSEAGWAGSNTTWAGSDFDASQVGVPFENRLVRLDVRYGTDAIGNGRGFWFDQVTVTDLELVNPDAQSDACEFLFLDGFESGNTSVWSAAVPLLAE